MLDRLVATLVVSSVSVSVGVTYVWAHGGSEAWAQPWAQAPRAQSATVQPSTGDGPTGFGNSVPRPRQAAVTPPRVETTSAPATGQTRPGTGRGTGAGGAGSPASSLRTAATAPPQTLLPAAPADTASADLPAVPSTPSSTAGDDGTGVEFTVASFNILGSRHTRNGKRGHFASGVDRVAGAVEVLEGHDASVVGFQEFEPDQRAAFHRITDGWDSYPGVEAPDRAGSDAVAWDATQWQAVERKLIDIPFNHRGDRLMPYVLLRHVVTGKQVWFTSFHNTPQLWDPTQSRREAATTLQVALINRLEATGHPLVVTGDMNQRERYFCRITGETRLVAAAGGSNEGSCRPPKHSRIDWIFASPTARFLDYEVDRSDLVRKVTDHPVLVSRIRFGD